MLGSGILFFWSLTTLKIQLIKIYKQNLYRIFLCCLGPFLFLLICIAGFMQWKRAKNRKNKILKNIAYHLQNIKKQPLLQQVLEYDKILDTCLYSCGKTGNMGTKMKQYGKKFKNENNIWYAHKMRNNIAHEMGFSLSKKEFEKIKRFYLREITCFL